MIMIFLWNPDDPIIFTHIGSVAYRVKSRGDRTSKTILFDAVFVEGGQTTQAVLPSPVSKAQLAYYL